MTTPSQSLSHSLNHLVSFSVGTKTADDESQGVLLYVAGMASDVSISRLDDSDISKVIYV